MTYPSEALRDVLDKTLGVPLFQEQAMKVAMVAAGFTRRRGRPAPPRDGGVADAAALIDAVSPEDHRRHARATATRASSPSRCFKQIQGFGEYGFPEIARGSRSRCWFTCRAWLKRHHPAAFCAALLNSQPMGFYAPAQIVRDAKEHGVEVRPVDVNESEWDCTLDHKRQSDGATERRRDGELVVPRFDWVSGKSRDFEKNMQTDPRIRKHVGQFDISRTISSSRQKCPSQRAVAPG